MADDATAKSLTSVLDETPRDENSKEVNDELKKIIEEGNLEKLKTIPRSVILNYIGEKEQSLLHVATENINSVFTKLQKFHFFLFKKWHFFFLELTSNV